MALTDLSFAFFVLPILAACAPFLKGKGKDIGLVLFSCIFVLLLDIESFKVTLVPLFDLLVFIFLRRINIDEEKIKNILNFLVLKSIALLAVWGILGNPSTPVGASILFFDIAALNFFRMSGRALGEYDFMLYTMFFPKLFAGPYISPKVFMKNKGREFSLETLSEGICLFIVGLGKDVIIVRQLDGIISNIFFHYEGTPSFVFAWSLAFLSAVKVYLYLSSFADMARGIGKIFNIEMTKGAFYPFFSSTVREFIKRLGISLSDTLGSAVSFWGRDIPKSLRSYVTAFVSILFINIILKPVGAGIGFSIYMAFALLCDYFFISKIKKSSENLSSVVTLIICMPAFIFLLPVDLMEGGKILLNLLFLGGSEFFFSGTLYFSAANLFTAAFAFILATGIIYAGGSFLKKVAPNVFKISSVVLVAAVMIITASFGLLEGGI